MRIMIDLPPDLVEALERRVRETGAQSRKALIEQIVHRHFGREYTEKPWGGRRPYDADKQDASLGKLHTASAEQQDIALAEKHNLVGEQDMPVEVHSPEPRKGSSMARPKNPDLQPPPTYGRKAAGVKPIPPFVGRKSGPSEE